MSIQVILCKLDEHTEAVNDRLVGGGPDRALEEEAIHDIPLRPDEVHEDLRLLEVGALVQQVLRPLHEDPPDRAGVEGGLPVLRDLGDLGTGQDVLAQQVLHVALEALLLVDRPLEHEADVLVDGLVVHVLGVGEALGREVVQQVHVGLRRLYFGDLEAPFHSCLRILSIEIFKQVVKGIV